MVKIVELQPDDWQKYKNIRLEALQTNPEAFGTTYEVAASYPDSKWQNILEDSNNGDVTKLFFASDDEKIIGMVNTFKKTDDTWMIVAMYVTPEYRNKKIGKKLLEKILHFLNTKGVAKAQIGVFSTQKPAFHLYTKLGFEIIKEDLKTETGENYCDFLLEKMVK